MSKIEALDRFKSVNIDFPFVQPNDFTTNGKLATSFDTIKEMIDRAIVLGFDTVAFDTNVPINAQTGGLQFQVEGSANKDKTFPKDIWKSIEYAESKGLKTIIDLNVRNVLNDVKIQSSNVGPEFKKDVFFNSVKQYETEIAAKANLYGVDGIRIGSFNFGFDQREFAADWQSVITSIRQVYTGTVGYQGSIKDKNNALYSLVDEIQVSFSFPLRLQSNYTAKDIVTLYFQPYMSWNKKISQESVFSDLKNLSDLYPNKKITLELDFQPGQSAGREDADPWSYVFEENPLLENAKDQNSLRPYPADLIDVKLNQQKIFGFFEFLGNYAENMVNGVQIFQYAPFAEASWMKNPNPSNLTGQVWNSIGKAGIFLNYNPEVEEAVARYFQRDWGFKTLHYGSEIDDRIVGSEVNDTFFITRGNDELDGGVGLDRLVVDGKRSGFNTTKIETTWLLEDKTPGNQNFGSNILRSIERVEFSDVSLSFDLDGNAGKVAKVLGAVFGKSALTNKEYVGIGLGFIDGGMSYQDLAGLAVSATNKTSSTEVCTLLWTNVFGQAPTAADIAPFKAMLDSNQLSIGQLTTLAADTSFNALNIDLVGLAQTGLEYV